MEETTFPDNDYVLVLLSKKITFSLEKKTTPQKRNLKVEVDFGKVTRNTKKKKKPVVLQAYRIQLYDKSCRRDRFFKSNVG